MLEVWSWFGEWLCWTVLVVAAVGVLSMRQRRITFGAYWHLVGALTAACLIESIVEAQPPGTIGTAAQVAVSAANAADEYLTVVTTVTLAVYRYRPRLARVLAVLVVLAAIARGLGGLSSTAAMTAGLLFGCAGTSSCLVVVRALRWVPAQLAGDRART